MLVKAVLAVLAGMASFLSPCILPLVPVYLAVLSGTSLAEMAETPGRARLIGRAIAFVAGFTLVFAVLGMTASFIGTLLLTYRRIIEIAAGALAVAFGVHFSGVWTIPFLSGQHRMGYRPDKGGILPSLVLGMAFSIGWTPCVGPALGAILGLASSAGTSVAGFFLLLAYSMGLGIPFILAAVLIRYLLPSWPRFARYARASQIAGGALLILMGVLMMAGFFGRLSGILGG